MRNKWKGHTGDGNDSDSGGELQGNEKDRQPRLNNLTPDYDLKLFMEAQAMASEKIVSINSRSIARDRNLIPTLLFRKRHVVTIAKMFRYTDIFLFFTF